MTKHLLSSIILLLPFVLFAQENVGVGTLTPASRLDVQGNASTTNPVINSRVNYIGGSDVEAFRGYSVTADGFGIGGKFTGGYKGIDVLGQGNSYGGAMYGIYSSATGTSGTRVGMYGTASGGTAANYGIWGNVFGGANHYAVYGQNTNLLGYAGYFNGRGFFTHELRADRDMIVDDTLWSSRIWSLSGILQGKAESDIELTIDRINSGPVTGFFEISNGAGENLFSVNEFGNGRILGNYSVDGTLGVGTTTPTTKLQILGGSDASFSTHGFIQTGLSSGWNMVIDENEILARSNGLENEMFIQRDGGDLLLCALELGSVGIGLTAGASIPAGYMFAVDGKIISEELRIQNSNNWPDYVFAKDYDLMSLDELKTSIETHKHLPNIPSAEVVESEGILIGDMQKRMMEKIEELTLYIIGQNEINKQQQIEIEKLKNSIEELKQK